MSADADILRTPAANRALDAMEALYRVLAKSAGGRLDPLRFKVLVYEALAGRAERAQSEPMLRSLEKMGLPPAEFTTARKALRADLRHTHGVEASNAAGDAEIARKVARILSEQTARVERPADVPPAKSAGTAARDFAGAVSPKVPAPPAPAKAKEVRDAYEQAVASLMKSSKKGALRSEALAAAVDDLDGLEFLLSAAADCWTGTDRKELRHQVRLLAKTELTKAGYMVSVRGEGFEVRRRPRG